MVRPVTASKDILNTDGAEIPHPWGILVFKVNVTVV